MISTSYSVVFLITLCLFIAPAAAFGAGDIPDSQGLNGYVWRHGDIATAVLLSLPVSTTTNYAFTELEMLNVYLGNWLRDYSQFVDTALLKHASEPLIRAIISIFAFKHFGLATGEFEVTKERLGCYQYVEHIDNPKGYNPGDPKLYKGLPDAISDGDPNQVLAIDPDTGMKNYIANSKPTRRTSADYIREQLQLSILKGRSDNDVSKKEAFMHLGAALHTLEDFAAHSNFVELCFHVLGEKDIFALVGDVSKVTVPSTKEEVAPLVTGTFGMLDAFHAILGEGDDIASHIHQGELDKLTSDLESGEKQFNQIQKFLELSINTLSKLSDKGLNKNEMDNEMAKIKKAADERRESTAPFQINNFWQSIEPAFKFHDNVVKWLKENEDLSVLNGTVTKIRKTIDIFVDGYISLFIRPLVPQFRDAIKTARDELVQQDKKGDIYSEASSDSNPSHSVIAKDHYSNILNTPAGLVATVITNWVARQVIRCWEQPADADKAIADIVQILHHPAFASAQPGGRSDIQKYMFQAVENWWNTHNETEKQKLRGLLCKSGVRNGLNNRKVTAHDFLGKPRGPAKFPGSEPPTVKRIVKESEVDNILREVSDGLDAIAKQVGLVLTGQGPVSDAVNQHGGVTGIAETVVKTMIKDAADKSESVLGYAPAPVQTGVKAAAEEAARLARNAQNELEQKRLAQQLREEAERQTKALSEGAKGAWDEGTRTVKGWLRF